MSLSAWTEATVGQVSEFLTGFPFASSAFAGSGVRLIRGSNVKRGAIDWSSNIARYWPAQDPSLRAFALRDGDIVVAMDGALVGRSFARIMETELPAYLVQRVARLRGRAIDQDLLYQWIGSRDFAKYVDDVKTHTAIPHISPRDIRDFKISMAEDLSEQRAVSAALRDADRLIATLEHLVAKKQAIKQGMMQQLLTGRTRLPGFSAEWTPVRLRDAGNTYGGLVGKSKDDFGTGSACFVTFMEVMAGARLLGRRLEQVHVRANERQNRVMCGDVLFNGSSETPEEVALAATVDYDPTPRTYLNSFCFGYRLKTDDLIEPAFLAHFFRSSQGREIVSVLAQGATRYNIAKTKLMDASPLLPPIDEQRAIVSVLRDSEAEIDALNIRLAKARAIKTGMMQQLLTGRVRLSVEAAS